MTIAFVQKATATGVNATSITTPAFGSATTVGNVLIGLGAFAPAGSGTTYTFTDSKTNTWTTDASVNNHTAGNSAGSAIGSTTLTSAGTGQTVKMSASGGVSSGIQLCAAEFSGLTTTVDQTANNTAASSTTSLTATTAATTNANDLLVATFCGDTNSVAVGESNPPTVNGSTTGVTSLQFVSATTVLAIESAYLILGSTGTQAVKWSYSSDASGQYSGAVAIYEGAASGGATGSAAITEDADTVSGTGSIGVSGSAAVAEGADTVAGTGSVGVSGSAAIAEGADAIAASGSVGVSGSAAITEGSDTVSGTGSATTGVDGQAALTEGADAVAATGSVGVDGSAAVAESADTVSAQGSVPSAPATGPTPAGRSKHRRRYYVEIDGVQFDVDDSEQARAILERAKTLAREAAEQSVIAIEKAQSFTTETIAPVKLSAPKIKASPELRLPLKSVRRSMNKIYREKSVILELRMWLELERRLQEDEDEAMLLLQ